MFDVEHYMPVLRGKRAERAALKDLGYVERVEMTPLVEITPWGFEPDNARAGINLQTKLPRIAEEMLEGWGHGRIFLDFCLLSPTVCTVSGQHPIDVLFEAGRSNKVAGKGSKTRMGPGMLSTQQMRNCWFERKEFCGSDFSEGDAYMWRGAHGENAGPGDPEAWLRAGLNHLR